MPARVTIEGRGSDEPIAAGHDAKSLALNRRVDIAIEGLRVIAAGALTVKKSNAVSPQVETVGVLDVRPVVKSPAPATSAAVSATTPSIDVEQLQPELRWLSADCR